MPMPSMPVSVSSSICGTKKTWVVPYALSVSATKRGPVVFGIGVAADLSEGDGEQGPAGGKLDHSAGVAGDAQEIPDAQGLVADRRRAFHQQRRAEHRVGVAGEHPAARKAQQLENQAADAAVHQRLLLGS